MKNQAKSSMTSTSPEVERDARSADQGAYTMTRQIHKNQFCEIHKCLAEEVSVVMRRHELRLAVEPFLSTALETKPTL